MKESTYDSLPEYNEVASWDYSKSPADFTFGDYRWICTCGACPEQYDVFYKDKCVAYGRLRFGNFTVSNDAYREIEFYRAAFSDGWKGCFDTQKEREYHINLAQKNIEAYYNNQE